MRSALRTRRRLLGLTLVEVAAAARVSKSLVSQVELGSRRSMLRESARRVGRVLGYTPEEVLSLIPQTPLYPRPRRKNFGRYGR